MTRKKSFCRSALVYVCVCVRACVHVHVCVSVYLPHPSPQSTKMILKFRETHIANMEKSRRVQSTAGDGAGRPEWQDAIVSQVL